MNRYEEMIAEFNQRADRAVYDKGEQILNKRVAKHFGYKPSFNEASNLIEEMARDAYEYDGYTDLGQLEPEEVYFLIVEYYGYDEADRYMKEIGYYENEAVA